MANKMNFYGGADYGLSYRDDDFLNVNYRTPAGAIGFPTDPRTANQIKAVSEKLNTGAKVIEFSMVSPDIAESIPNQHLEELRKLKKIAGFEFTVHGPLVEPTGLTQNGVDEYSRQQAERQMWNSLERAKMLVEKNENVIVTFHASNGLPETETSVVQKPGEEPTKTQMLVIDEREGKIMKVEQKDNYLLGDKKQAVQEQFKKINKDNWNSQLSNATLAAIKAEEILQDRIPSFEKEKGGYNEFENKSIRDIYEFSKSEEGKKQIEQYPIEAKKFLEKISTSIAYGEVYAKQAYQSLQDRFTEAYESAKRENREADMRRLSNFREQFQVKMKAKDLEDPKNLLDLTDQVNKGINVLSEIETPMILRPLKDFAIEKASQTFGNLAIKSYKKFGEGAPVISIENPPVGMGLSRANELNELVQKSRERFVDNAQSLGLSKSQAEKQAEKLIGVTWDLGHINMLKKYGFDDTAIVKQTEAIKENIKHVHLSDNFGLEHTELPMGMGNVPTKAHLDLIDGYNKKIKKIVETGGQWFQAFNVTPFKETLTALGSPIYALSMGPTWNDAYGSSISAGTSPYFAGMGHNPEIHHSIYGAGFSGLPTELGGQIQGRNSRFSGTSME